MRTEGAVVWRVASFALGVLVVFAALMRTVYLESVARARAYEVRELMEREARLRNHNAALRVDVAYRRDVRRTVARAVEKGFVEVRQHEVTRAPPAPREDAREQARRE